MAIQFAVNETQVLTFPYGDFRPVTGRDGENYMYTVDGEHGRDRLFADPALHGALQEAGMEPGRTLRITRLPGPDLVWLTIPDADKPEAAEVATSLPTQRTTAKPDFAQMERLIGACLATSWAAWKGLEGQAPFTSEDVRAVGISLFLECARKGIVPAVEAEGTVLDVAA